MGQWHYNSLGIGGKNVCARNWKQLRCYDRQNNFKLIMAKLLTYDELLAFLQKSGKTMDYDGHYGGECVDVIKFALDLCHGIKPGAI